jgi:hypothetical protein
MFVCHLAGGIRLFTQVRLVLLAPVILQRIALARRLDQRVHYTLALGLHLLQRFLMRSSLPLQPHGVARIRCGTRGVERTARHRQLAPVVQRGIETRARRVGSTLLRLETIRACSQVALQRLDPPASYREHGL